MSVGMMGIAPEAFDRMTCAEVMYVHQGYAHRAEQEFRTAMNVERWGCYAIMSSVADLKGMTAYELLPLPWDELPGKTRAQRPQSGKLNKKEIIRRRDEALSNIKLLEQ